MRILLFLIISQVAYCSEVIWQNNKPTEFLIEVFKITELKDVNNLAAAADQSNAKWVRPKFMESWHAFSLLDAKKKTALNDVIKKSVLTQEKPPKKQYYDVVIVLGCFPDRLTRRLNYLIELHERGVRFGKICLLGMTRYIKTGSGFDKEIELPNNSNKELSSIEILWNQLEKSEELKQIPVEILTTQKKLEGYGAASEKLLRRMARTSAVSGMTCLVVSDGCYGCNQGALVERILEKFEVTVETVWDKSEVEYGVEVVLDCIAKGLHYLYKRDHG